METAIVKPQREMMKSMAPAIVCLSFWLFTAELRAQEEAHSRPREVSRGLALPSRTGSHDSSLPRTGKTVSTSSNLVSTTISLGLIVGALFLVGRGMKKFGFRPAPSLPLEAFELLGQKTIEPRLTVHLVRCGSRVLVLGTGTDGIRTLSEIDDPAEVERITEACLPRDETRTPPRTRSAASSLASRTAVAAQRLIPVFAALGILLATAAPAAAQPPRSTVTSERSRESGRTAVPDARPKEVRPAAWEAGLPLDLDPKQLGSPQQMGLSLKLLVLMTVFSLAPSLLMMTTCFVRFAVALGLLRQALGTQQGLPNPVLTAICMFLTFLVMAPVWQQSYDEGIRPYTNPTPGDAPIDETTALTRAVAPIRTFMEQQIDKANNSDAVWMLLEFQRPPADSPSASSWHEPQSYSEVPLHVLAPAYLLSELKIGFLIGFQLFLPFLVIDLVVAMTLTGLGLTMLPPSMVSLPFKLLLFVLIDGWFLTVGMLLESVRVV